jgi:hypothetical protein
MPPFIHAARIFDNYLIAVDVEAFWAYLILTVFFFAVALPWLVNRPMKHSPGLWALSTVDRNRRRK